MIEQEEEEEEAVESITQLFERNQSLIVKVFVLIIHLLS
jgi:predicted negative regulator of RcsB-dependent stress response